MGGEQTSLSFNVSPSGVNVSLSTSNSYVAGAGMALAAGVACYAISSQNNK